MLLILKLSRAAIKRGFVHFLAADNYINKILTVPLKIMRRQAVRTINHSYEILQKLPPHVIFILS